MRGNLLGLCLLAFSQIVWSAAHIEHWQTEQGARVFFVRTDSLPIDAFTPISAKDTTLNSTSEACSIASRAAGETVRDPASSQSTT